ncbi:hypothetical protein Z043_102200, partial [Scleropages formosus]
MTTAAQMDLCIRSRTPEVASTPSSATTAWPGRPPHAPSLPGFPLPASSTTPNAQIPAAS